MNRFLYGLIDDDKGVQAAGEEWEKDHLQTKLGTDSIREFLEHAIKNLIDWKADDNPLGKARLVVFIDDLDRCQPATAFKLLEALKIHFSIPNCIFVLGMNQQTVVAAGLSAPLPEFLQHATGHPVHPKGCH